MIIYLCKSHMCCVLLLFWQLYRNLLGKLLSDDQIVPKHNLIIEAKYVLLKIS